MPRFRAIVAPSATSSNLLAVSQLIDALVQSGHFFADPALRLRWSPARAEEVPWEVFRGRLLDVNQTRQTRRFLAWNVAADDAEPLLSVKLDVEARAVHIVRGLLCHVWEGHEEHGVIVSREVMRWMRELVGTISLDRFPDAGELRDELICVLWQAVVGTSRLPLTSVEAPLPAFVLGQLHYVERPDGEALMQTLDELIEHGLHAGLADRERVKLLEFVLRRAEPEQVDEIAERFLRRWQALGRSVGEIPGLLRSLFNEVSLSPWTRLAENALAWLRAVVARGALGFAEQVDFLGYLLRQLGRHLTAYDLVTFHHRGANYPDALLADMVLKEYLRLIEDRPDLFADVRRRRALRQGCMMRRHYEGHLVPDAPTSPGENARVMPEAFPRVPEEQLLQLLRRERRLFAGDPLTGLLGPRAREILRQSFVDLADAGEQREMGMAVFIDRPLGFFKVPTEPDQTPLLAHEAYSPSLARRRIEELGRLARELALPFDAPAGLAPVRGVPLDELAESPRPVASLADARRVAEDFVIVRTLPGGLAELLGLFDFRMKPHVAAMVPFYQLRVLAFFDDSYEIREVFRIYVSAGYVHRAGIEYPAGLDSLMKGRGLPPLKE